MLDKFLTADDARSLRREKATQVLKKEDPTDQMTRFVKRTTQSTTGVIRPSDIIGGDEYLRVKKEKEERESRIQNIFIAATVLLVVGLVCLVVLHEKHLI